MTSDHAADSIAGTLGEISALRSRLRLELVNASTEDYRLTLYFVDLLLAHLSALHERFVLAEEQAAFFARLPARYNS